MKVNRAMALHEAGHVVVGDALGMHGLRVCWRGKDLANAALVSARPSAHEHFMLAAWSLGGGAATIRNGRAPGLECRSDLRAALDSIERAARKMRGSRRELMRRAAHLAQSIVDARWAAVRRVARIILEREGRVGERELRAALSEYRSEAA